MTTLAATIRIITFQDILDAMAQNPELEAEMRRHLQDEDFRNLPQAVARLAAGLEELAGIVRAMAEREERRDADIAKLKAGQARQESDIAELKAGQAELKEGQARHDADIAELKAGQAELKEGQARLEARVEEGLTRLETGQARMQGELNRLAGSEYERNIARRLRRNAERHFGIRRARQIHSVILPNNNALLDLLDDAFAQGLISREEADAAEVVDMVIRGEDQTGAPRYAVIEASVTVHQDDVDRALSRSRIIAKATEAGAVPAVAGVNIPDQVRRYAAGLQVAAIVASD